MHALQNGIAGTADDPTVEFAELEIDGQTYHLAYDYHAIARAEGLLNGQRRRPVRDKDGTLTDPGEEKVSLLHGIAAVMNSGADARELEGLFYAALGPAQPDITLKQADRLIRLDTIPDICRAIEKAYIASMPTKKQLAQNPTVGGGAPLPTPKSGSTPGPPPASSSDSPTPNSTP